MTLSGMRPAPDQAGGSAKPGQPPIGQWWEKWSLRFRESLGWYIAWTIFTSLIPLAFIYILCADAGVLWERGFNPFDIFSGSHPLQARSKGTISIPFLSDLPSLLLSLTSTSSIVTYRILRRLRYSLQTDLSHSRLLNPGDVGPGIQSSFDAMLSRSRLRVIGNIVSFIVTLGVSVGFYKLAASSSYLFKTVSRLTGSNVSTPDLRDSWWAAHNWLLATCWIGLGFVGSLLAILQGWDYLKIVKLCDDLRRARVLDHVPPWRADQYGWRPITRLVDLKAIGGITFVLAYLPVIYLLHGINAYVNIALVILLLMAVVQTVYQLQILVKLPAMHREIVRTQVDAVAGRLGPLLEQSIQGQLGSSEYPELAVYLLRTDQLNRAMEVRMYQYVRAAQFIGPVIVIISLVSAFVTISGV